MSEQTDVKSCCVTGHLHKGDPLGTTKIIHGLNTYISTPKGSSKGTLIFLPDIFGIYPNAKLLADEWAGQGYTALFPDVLEGDAIPVEMLSTIAPNNAAKEQATMASKAADTAKTMASIGPWVVKHREAVSKPIIENFVNAIKADSSFPGKVGAIGFCWGGRYALVLAQDGSPAKVDVAIGNHPSFLVNADVENIKTVPVAIFKGTNDDEMSESALDEIEGILSKNLGDKLLVKRYPDMVHGFTIRGDQDNEKETKAKEDANNAAMAFVAKAFGN